MPRKSADLASLASKLKRHIASLRRPAVPTPSTHRRASDKELWLVLKSGFVPDTPGIKAWKESEELEKLEIIVGCSRLEI